MLIYQTLPSENISHIPLTLKFSQDMGTKLLQYPIAMAKKSGAKDWI